MCHNKTNRMKSNKKAQTFPKYIPLIIMGILIIAFCVLIYIAIGTAENKIQSLDFAETISCKNITQKEQECESKYPLQTCRDMFIYWYSRCVVCNNADEDGGCFK